MNCAINLFFMKLFQTSDKNIVESCREKFGFILPSIQLYKRRKSLSRNTACPRKNAPPSIMV